VPRTATAAGPLPCGDGCRKVVYHLINYVHPPLITIRIMNARSEIAQALKPLPASIEEMTKHTFCVMAPLFLPPKSLQYSVPCDFFFLSSCLNACVISSFLHVGMPMWFLLPLFTWGCLCDFFFLSSCGGTYVISSSFLHVGIGFQCLHSPSLSAFNVALQAKGIIHMSLQGIPSSFNNITIWHVNVYTHSYAQPAWIRGINPKMVCNLKMARAAA